MYLYINNECIARSTAKLEIKACVTYDRICEYTYAYTHKRTKYKAMPNKCSITNTYEVLL
jgi:hypothetical protein